ncbi:MAG: ArnT family glycosyltransferase, partial [Bryobacteraceae bacterium]
MNTRRNAIWFWGALGAALVASRACHVNILWADEDYHLAAAIQMLHGKMLYRDLWYDKPPLNAMVGLLFGAWPGWPLRIVASLIAVAGCALSYRFASRLWGAREGFYAAALLAFFLIFYSAPATIPVEPDTLMVVPHLAAVYLAWRQRPFAAGAAAGIAFLLNTKGLFVLAACLAFVPAGWPLLAAGFLVPNAAMLGWLAWNGALPAYFFDVWRWGLLYAAAPLENARGAVAEALGWLGFHAALAIGAVVFWRKEKQRRGLALWAAISLAAVAVGWRFLPRYFNQLLPPLTIIAARGIALCVGPDTVLPAGRQPALQGWQRGMA